MTAPEKIWVHWPQKNSTGLAFSCQSRPPALRQEYTRSDLVDPATIREAALREAAAVVHKWWFEDGNELPQELILALIGEKK
jgi:hypothetical protein